MSIVDPVITIAGFLVGFVVGISGVGGGALMTPFLVFYGIPPGIAVGTDLLYAAITKVSGVIVYHRERVINWRTVGRLLTGSLPASLIVLWWIGHQDSQGMDFSLVITRVLGISLILTAVVLLLKRRLNSWANSKQNKNLLPDKYIGVLVIVAGMILGALVTLSSVGAGALGAAILVLLCPLLQTRSIIGIDLAHAIPLTAISGLGYWYLGQVNFELLGSLLLGSIPGILIGTKLGVKLPEVFMQKVLATALLFIGLRIAF